MTITKKTILYVIIATIVMFSLIITISNVMFLRSFNDMEKNAVSESSLRVTDALSVLQNKIDAFCSDWANWDDTYYFAGDGNGEYIDKNLNDGTFVSNDINVMMVLNTNGEMLYGKIFDFTDMETKALPGDYPVYLSQTVLPVVSEISNSLSGITMFSGRPMITACHFLLTSQGKGPSTGYLLVGRFIDDTLIKLLSATANLDIVLVLIQENGQTTELDRFINSNLGFDSIFVQTEPNDMISVYTLVDDIVGTPAFIFKITEPRNIHDQGVKTITYVHASILFFAVIFCGVFVFLIRNLILARLTALSNAVNSIGSKSEISNRVQVKGKDELSGLADNINNMLESLEKSELRREAQKEIIGQIIANTPNGILGINENGNISIVNDAFRKMFGLANRSLSGVKLDEIPDISDIAIEVNNFRLSRMTGLKKEIKQVRSGVDKTYIATFTRLKEEELYILYLTDISEERSQQESLYLTDRLASIGEMASGIAHELNNPLTSIIGLSEIVMHNEVPESIREDMDMIKSESHRAAGIVKNLLSFARKNATIKQETNINAVINDVLKLRSYEHGVNNIKIIEEFDRNLPDIMVDHSQIQQVFINIILNAEYAIVSAHGKGTIKIKTELADDKVEITFTDDGSGIEPGNLRHIFDPFFTTKEVGKGTGLGLSISYGIVTAHNGRIYATSEFGKGSTFVIELPRFNPDKKEVKPNA